MLQKRVIYIITGCTLLMAACMGNQESHQNQEGQVDVEQSSFRTDEVMTRSDIADHLSNLALKVSDVEDAATVVAGEYAVVGIDIKKDIERQRTSTVKRTVLEALEHDPYGRQAVVIADADIMDRLRGMKEDIKNGKPVKGVTEELANIVSRYMPTVPIDEDRDKEPLKDEKQTK